LDLEGLKAPIISDGEELTQYSFLGSKARVVTYTDQMSFDVLIVLDCNSMDRLGARAELVNRAKHVIVIDHHVLEHNPIPASLQYIDSAFCSVGAQLYAMYESRIDALSPEDQIYFAECIYTTLLNDTNNFVNANTDAAVFDLAAKLVRHGANPHRLYFEFLQNNSVSEMAYIGDALSHIEVHEGNILFLHSDYAAKKRLQVNPEDFKQATRYVQGVRGLTALVYFREDEPGLWKISLRALHLDVQKIAALHGGGGHRQAAGCRLQGSLEDVKATILQDIQRARGAQ
jgi:phosphoesterase RecJ-like protein